MKPPIYLDHPATTPLDPRVLETMGLAFEHFGNPASRGHAFGWKARELVEEARAQTAELLGATAAEIVFTSGATEAANLAIKGTAEMHLSPGHVITSQTEHRAVLDSCGHLEQLGWEVSYLAPDSTGRVDVARVTGALREDTRLVALMWGNNEVGTLNPVAEIGDLCHARGVPFFTDATQAVGKIPVDVRASGVDLLCLSAHKFDGPKGVGALYVRRRDPRVRIAPQLHGGGHERGLRSGTLNVPGIVGLGSACAIAASEMPTEAARVRALRDDLEARLGAGLEGMHFFGNREERLPGILDLAFDGVDAEELLGALANEVALSSGAACSSASMEPSHVLAAMGVPAARIAGSIRFGIGRSNTPEEIERAAQAVVRAVARLRGGVRTASPPAST